MGEEARIGENLPTGWVRDENGALRRETIRSMLRRLKGWDYRGRAIYQITITLADRASGALGRLEVKGPAGWVSVEAAREQPSEARQPKAAREPYRPEAVEARVVASELGEVVKRCWREIAEQWPGVRPLGCQLMPDHFHGILFVERRQEKTLGNIVGSFKSKSSSRVKQLLAARGQERDTARGQERGGGASGAGREGGGASGAGQEGGGASGAGQEGGGASGVGQEGGGASGAGQEGGGASGVGQEGGGSCASSRATGLWSPGYQDTILFHEGQLDNMFRYLADNPRRRAIKALFPDLFRVVGELALPLRLSPQAAARGWFSALGNRFLLERPLAQVQVSRRDFGYQREPKPGGGLKIVRNEKGEPVVDFTTTAFEEKKAALFAAAKHGSVLISPCVSDGEREIARLALGDRLPLVTLHNKGFSKLQKPSGRYFDACADGRLLMLAPAAWPYQPGEKAMTRFDATAMNRLCQWLVGEDAAEINYHGMKPENIDALARAAAKVETL